MIAEFLENHLNTPFPPGAHGLDLPNVDLELLDADVVGIAQAYLKEGRLSREQRDILAACIGDIRRIIAQLPGDTHEYFARLHALAVAVLDERAVRGP
jgi:hypothetical protein